MIYIFKTSVSSKKEVKHLTPHLNSFLQECNWNFDLEDCDNILRIDTSTKKKEIIIKFLLKEGFECVELTF